MKYLTLFVVYLITLFSCLFCIYKQDYINERLDNLKAQKELIETRDTTNEELLNINRLIVDLDKWK